MKYPTDFAVIFDLDGLLVDSEPIWSESAKVLLGHRGKAYDPSLKPLLLGRRPLEVAGIMIRHYGLNDEPAALVAERVTILTRLYQDNGIPLLPGAEELVAAVAEADLPRAVASGSPPAVVDRVLQLTGLIKQLPIYLSADQVEHGKPAPDVFLAAAALLGVTPTTCVVLEDSGAGVQAAVNAGMACVAVPDPGTPFSDVEGADLVLGSLNELSLERLSELVKGREADL